MSDVTEMGLIRQVALGDVEAAISLCYHCADVADSGDGDPMIATIEGLTLARLAASTGNLVGMGQFLSFCGRMVDLCVDANRHDLAAHYRGEAFALADIAADMVPSEISDVMTAGLNIGAVEADAASMRCAARMRELWAEILKPKDCQAKEDQPE